MPPTDTPLPTTSLGSLPTSDTAPVIEAIERLTTPYPLDLPLDPAEIDGFYQSPQAVVLPKGQDIRSLKPLLDEYRTAPERIRAAADLTTLDSLIAYVKRFRNHSTALFAQDEPTAPQLLAVLDYHAAVTPPPADDCPSSLPIFCTHTATYRFPLSDPLMAWIAATERCQDPRKGGMFTQEAFAFFLQDRARDIENPPLDWMMVDQATVQEVCEILNLHDDNAPRDQDGKYLDTEAVQEDEEEDRYIPRDALYKLRRIRFGSAHLLEKLAIGISLSLELKVEQQFDPKTGRKTINFKDEHEARSSTGRKVIVPDMFFVNIPVFESGRRHLLPVRLYYRKAGTGLMWGVELVEPERMIRRAVAAAAREAATQTTCPLYFGKPGLSGR